MGEGTYRSISDSEKLPQPWKFPLTQVQSHETCGPRALCTAVGWLSGPTLLLAALLVSLLSQQLCAPIKMGGGGPLNVFQVFTFPDM